MILTIDVEPQVKDHLIWLLTHIDKGVKILSEEDDTVFTSNELKLRDSAMDDFKKGNTVSEEEFAKEFFGEL